MAWVCNPSLTAIPLLAVTISTHLMLTSPYMLTVAVSCCQELLSTVDVTASRHSLSSQHVTSLAPLCKCISTCHQPRLAPPCASIVNASQSQHACPGVNEPGMNISNEPLRVLSCKITCWQNSALFALSRMHLQLC